MLCLAGLHVLDKTNKNNIKKRVNVKKSKNETKIQKKCKKAFLHLCFQRRITKFLNIITYYIHLAHIAHAEFYLYCGISRDVS